MKILFLILFAIPFLTFCMNAEEDSVSSKYAIGPYLAMKGGINGGSILQGRKNAFAFCSEPEVGASFEYKLHSQNHLAILLELGYTGFSYGVKDVSNSNVYTENFSYLTFSPGFKFSVITLNLILGYPLRADYGPEIHTSELNFITAIQLGFEYPLYEDATGDLNIFLKADYMLSGIFKEFSKNDPLRTIIPVSKPTVLTDSYNPRAASIQLGFSYLFNL